MGGFVGAWAGAFFFNGWAGGGVLFGGATFLWVLFAADCCKHTEGVVNGQCWLWLAFLWFGLSRFLDSLEKGVAGEE